MALDTLWLVALLDACPEAVCAARGKALREAWEEAREDWQRWLRDCCYGYGGSGDGDGCGDGWGSGDGWGGGGGDGSGSSYGGNGHGDGGGGGCGDGWGHGCNASSLVIEHEGERWDTARVLLLAREVMG